MVKDAKKKSNVFINNLLLGNKSIIILILLVIILSFASDVFMTSSNILNVIRQVAVTAVACAGFTIILGSGHMDLSVGYILCFVGVIMGKLMVAGVPIPVAIITGLALGACCGFINASLITYFELPPFIVTLATQEIFRGLAFVITKNLPVSNLPEAFVNIGQGYWGPIPIPIYIMFAAIIAMWIIVNRTRFGRQAIAMGGNAEAARVSGVRINRVRMGVYMTVGFYSAMASVLLTARSASAQLSAGSTLAMDAIASVVIGGTSMKGGNANVFGSLIGCIIVGVVNNGLNLLRVDANWQIVAKGLIILIAVILDVVTTRIYAKMSVR